jgi:hypothetical protein
MSPHEQNDDLGRLLNDAVSDVEPRSGIQAIRSRTSAKESTMTTTRNWIFGAFGAAVATAAVITGVVLAGNNDPSADNNPGPADPPSSDVTELPSEDPTDEPTDDPTQPPTSEPPVSGPAVPVYYVGETPQGPRLYREFHPGGANRLLDAANAAASGTPDDPDYRSAWPEGTTFDSVSFDGVGKDGLIQVTLSDESLHDRPAGMTEREAQLAIEQVIYTLQGVVGARAPVQFRLGDNPIDQVLGVFTSEPLANGPVLDTLALVNLTMPAQDQVVSGDLLKVSGVANSFEANVVIRLQRYEGTFIALEDYITAAGCCENKLFPFSKSIDISDVEPGRYILMASTDDPSAGEGPGHHTNNQVTPTQ